MAEETMRQIQWFPGHMTKTQRMIAANLSLVDAIVEILDARIPYSSRNPEMDRMTGTKPKLLLLNKADLADSSATAKWISAYQAQDVRVLAVDCRSGKGVKQFAPTVRDLLASLLRKRQAHGIEGVPIRLMVVGIPNVGKSSFINRMAKTKRTKVEDRPGVTCTKQWVKIGDDMELLDMPGVLWPKFDDQEVAQKLAFTGAINDNIMDLESLASLLIEQLAKDYPNALIERYRLTAGELETQGFEILEALGRHRSEFHHLT